MVEKRNIAQELRNSIKDSQSACEDHRLAAIQYGEEIKKELALMVTLSEIPDDFAIVVNKIREVICNRLCVLAMKKQDKASYFCGDVDCPFFDIKNGIPFCIVAQFRDLLEKVCKDEAKEGKVNG